MKKWKWLTTLAVLIAAGFIGYHFAYQYVTDKVMDGVVEQMIDSEEMDKLLADPKIQQLIADGVDGETLQQLQEKAGTGNGSGAGAGDGIGNDNGTANGHEGDNGISNGTGTGNGSETGTGNSGGKKLVVKDKGEAIKLILDKFSIGELKDLAARAKGMSKEEQEELLSRFTEEELESLKIIGLMEVAKRKN